MTRKEQQIPTFVLSCICKISSTISDKLMSNSFNKRIRKQSYSLPAECAQNKNKTVRDAGNSQ